MSMTLQFTPEATPYKGLLRRSVLVSLFLGSVLTLANQTAAILGQEPLRLLPMAINYTTPLLVVAMSQFLAIRATQSSRRQTPETPLQTARRHGIPIRAAAISLTIGSLIATIFAATTGTNSLTPVLLSQIYGLPLIFSTLSQTLAVRRLTR